MRNKKCLRCKASWTPVVKNPVRCPRCRTLAWNREPMKTWDRKPRVVAVVEDTTQLSRGIGSIIDVFKKINPTISFSNPFQRKAAQKLIDAYGIDKAVAAAEAAVGAQGEQFAPVITNPSELVEKMGKLVVWHQREGDKPKGHAVFKSKKTQ